MKIKPLIKYSCLFLFILLFGILTQENILFPRFNDSYANRFQKEYTKKESELNKIIIGLNDLIINNRSGFSGNAGLLNYNGLLNKRGLAIFIYENDSLVFWSDNTIPISDRFSKSGIDSSFIYLKNAWYVPYVKTINNIKVVGLIQIKQVYQYENKYLVNKFQGAFNFPSSVKISTKPVPQSHPVVNSKNRIVFSLVFDASSYHILYQTYIPAVCFFLAILFLFFILYKIIKNITSKKLKNIAIIAIIGIVFIARLLMMKFGFPGIFYHLELFKPQYFAVSDLLPSLGDLFIWSIIIFFIVLLIYNEFTLPVPKKYSGQNHVRNMIALGIYITGVLVFFSLIFILIRSIIINSTISFEVNKLLTFDFYSIVGYIIIMMLFTSFVFLFDKTILSFLEVVSFKRFNIIFIFFIIAWFALFRWIDGSFYWVSLLFLMLFGNLYSYGKYYSASTYHYSMIIIVVLFSAYTVFIVTKFSTEKNNDQKKVLISNLANEHDPIAEYLLREIDKRMPQDSFIIKQLLKENYNVEKINKYLSDKYFNTYFNRYSLQNITICDPQDSVYLLAPDNIYKHCYSFFKTMMIDGNKIPETNFYYVERNDGRIYYLGFVEYKNINGDKPVTLFLELRSKLISEEIGYPVLLLDKSFNFRSKLKELSYAKYYKGQLISQFGTYSYNLSSRSFDNSDSKFTIVKSDNMDHLVYRPGKDSLVILSNPSVMFLDILISFSYTLLFFGLVISIVIFIVNVSVIKVRFQSNFKNNIQYYIMLVLFLSLIILGGGNLYYNVRQYYNMHYDILSEKLQSIYNELSGKIGSEKSLKGDWHSYPYNSLNETLIRLSDIFYVDINLYNTKGDLIATSRPEIFDKSLIGTKINPEAYELLKRYQKPEVIHKEGIGGLSYISAYAPFNNNINKLVAFINIPYFTHQEDLAKEISTMVVATVNIYVVLLLFSFLISVIIARKITLPLRMIQTKFSEIRLGQKYEKINYASNDEIGGLVNEYNRMVTELEKSVNLLARSERESAWREMAKQIAHEINNPLTPMKLNVQHLYRAWVDKNERFDEYIERISRTLIDEIDNLSAIATEFSNFAKMPTASNQEIELITKINNAVNLFTNDNVEFIINYNKINKLYIYADKEQISRVFINLFNNAIQSVEKGIKPVIKIELNAVEGFVTVKVSDNGKGIPKEIQEKLFMPNFTTKSSGMGLGLAIVKNIVDTAGGSISYETDGRKGTAFIITLPVYSEQ